MNIDLSDLREGDELFSARHGTCIVTKNHNIHVYFKTIDNNFESYCFINGKSDSSDRYATYAHNEKEYLAYVQWVYKQESLPDLKVDDLLVVWEEDPGDYHKPRFSRFCRHPELPEFERGYNVICFDSGRDSFTAASGGETPWRDFRLPTPEERETKQVDQSNRESLV